MAKKADRETINDEQLEKIKHKHKMDELEYMRETERLKHEWEKERMRIKSAEIRKQKTGGHKNG